MKVDRKGITRIVFVFNRFVIKIPNFIYQHNHFLHGCLANWNERRYTKMWNSCNIDFKNRIAPSIFCTWFGLIQIQKKCLPLERDLTEEEKMYFKPLCGTDIKKDNFGVYKGRIVCVDYP